MSSSYLTFNEQRELDWYKSAIPAIQSGEDRYSGVCSTLCLIDGNFNNLWVYEDMDSAELLPVLFKHRTRGDVDEFVFWFNSHEERLVALDKCVEELSNRNRLRRELYWYELALKYFQDNPKFSGSVYGVCKALYDCGIDLYQIQVDEEMDYNKELMPTLYSLKTVRGVWWFEYREERIEALEKAIKILKTQLNEN
jgi:hypothetical protein